MEAVEQATCQLTDAERATLASKAGLARKRIDKLLNLCVFLWWASVRRHVYAQNKPG